MNIERLEGLENSEVYVSAWNSEGEGWRLVTVFEQRGHGWGLVTVVEQRGRRLGNRWG